MAVGKYIELVLLFHFHKTIISNWHIRLSKHTTTSNSSLPFFHPLIRYLFVLLSNQHLDQDKRTNVCGSFTLVLIVDKSGTNT